MKKQIKTSETVEVVERESLVYKRKIDGDVVRRNVRWILTVLVLVVVVSGVSVYATATYLAGNVTYTKPDGTPTDVATALNELYELKNSANSSNTFSDDLKNWIAALGSNSKLSLEDVTDNQLLNKLMNNENAVNYMISNNNIRNAVVGSENAMKSLISVDSTFTKTIQNSQWRNSILTSSKCIQVLDNSNPTVVPRMTSNTAPSGTAFASSSFSSGIAPWAAFDRNASGYWNPAAGAAYKNQYIGYSFTKPVWVYKTYVSTFLDGNKSYVGKQKMYCVIEASNDKNNWVTITNEFYEGEKTIISNTNCNMKFQHYRLRITRTTGDTNQNGGGNSVVETLQFYGK